MADFGNFDEINISFAIFSDKFLKQKLRMAYWDYLVFRAMQN